MMANESPKEVEVGAQRLAVQLELAQTGAGSDWMDAEEGLAFAEYGLSLGFGVSKMEAFAEGEYRGKLQLYHQILGLDDDEENWEAHKNPEFDLRLVKDKYREASRDALTLKYKFWFDFAAQ